MYRKNIVTIGGGTGSFTLLSGIRNYPFNIKAIVSMADDGGSTGRLRDELGVLPPGDVRQCLVALSEESQILRNLFNYRFESGDIKGHTLGNLFLSALEKMTGDFHQGLDVAMRILKIKGEVLPVANESANLFMQLKDGTILKGEHEINCSDQIEKKGVKRIYFKPGIKASRKALIAIKEADIIVLGPGNYYASILPNILVEGIGRAICRSKAKVIYVANLMSKKGNCDLLKVDDYVESLHQHLKKERIDYVLFNTTQPNKKLVDKYFSHGEKLVELDSQYSSSRSYRIIKADLLNRKTFSFSKGDVLAGQRAFIRHDSRKLAQVIMYLSEMENYMGLIKGVD